MTAQQFLKKYPSNEATDILAHLLGLNKTKVLMSNKKLSRMIVAEAERMLKQYASGKPLAYILGYKYFYGLRLKVTKDVLIPRPEPELMVEDAIKLAKNPKNTIRTILDVGTGSGNIVIAIAKNLPKGKYKFFASDFSKPALAVAKQNAKAHGVNVEFLHSNLLRHKKLAGGGFDLITANLPYVPIKKYKKHFAQLRFEPGMAIYARKGGLELYTKFFSQIAKLSKKPKYILLEFDSKQKEVLNQMVKYFLPHAKVSFARDYLKHWRHARIKLGS